MENKSEAIRGWLQNSAFLRVLFIGFVVLILQIPIAMISSQINERQMTRDQAYNDITEKWGRQQTIMGPRLVIPYYEFTYWKNQNGAVEKSKKVKYAVFLPETLRIDADVKNDLRYRGLFEVPVYQSNINLTGTFTKPDFRQWGIDPARIVWNKAQLLVGISDVRAIKKQARLNWNDKTYKFEPGLGKTNLDSPGLHVPSIDLRQTEKFKFKIPLALNGSAGLYVAPMAEETQVSLTSDWPDPSFNGYKLPNQREITATGFTANWSISHISRNYPQQWLNRQVDGSKYHQSLVGVDFISPVDNYRMVERSIKYVMLFLLLTFVAIWLIEVIAKVRVHLLQYLLLGLGMCVFYLLLLALSEHIGFLWAYVIASIAVIVKTTLYSKAVLKTGKRAALIGSGISVLYLYLFSLLQEQNYSMLFGSVGVFLILAAVMYVTRNIDWYNLRKS
jgi:inner membrane protein